jgi:hypothetical protein
MTWKKMLLLMGFIMLAVMLAVFVIISRQRVAGSERTVMGVRSIFPAGGSVPVRDAENGWLGIGFARGFRFFSRPTPRGREDFRELVRKNFSCLPLRAELSLFEGGVYALQKGGKGYRLFCVFYRGGTSYWADMVSADSLNSSCLAFERFILHLEIAGERPAAAVAGQIASLHKKVPLFFMQTPGQLLGMMTVFFILVLLVSSAANLYSGSCPQRRDWAAETCSPGATLFVRRMGGRKITACCLCREGEFMVVYRYRRPFMKIDIARERQKIIWGKSSFRYENIRIILKYEDFQRWREILMD